MRRMTLAPGATRLLAVLLLLVGLAGCGTTSVRPSPVATGSAGHAAAKAADASTPAGGANDTAREVVMYALGLIDVGYSFGGKNPEAGLDCSGMVSFIYRNAANIDLRGSAADIAKHGKVIERKDLQAGDLVFFNTLHRPYSHVGIYIGDDRFIHAPSTNGRIRIESLKTKYFATRYEAARTFFAG